MRAYVFQYGIEIGVTRNDIIYNQITQIRWYLREDVRRERERERKKERKRERERERERENNNNYPPSVWRQERRRGWMQVQGLPKKAFWSTHGDAVRLSWMGSDSKWICGSLYRYLRDSRGYPGDLSNQLSRLPIVRSKVSINGDTRSTVFWRIELDAVRAERMSGWWVSRVASSLPGWGCGGCRGWGRSMRPRCSRQWELGPIGFWVLVKRSRNRKSSMKLQYLDRPSCEG